MGLISIDYSLNFNKKIYASADGGGIIVDGDNLKFIGKTYLFHEGTKISLR